MRIQPLLLAFLLAVVALVALLVPDLLTPTRADDGGPSTVYLSVSGEGPTAKGWFAGAPPAGMLVQDALDHFSEKGYRVAAISPSTRPVISILTDGQQLRSADDLEHYYVILLER